MFFARLKVKDTCLSLKALLKIALQSRPRAAFVYLTSTLTPRISITQVSIATALSSRENKGFVVPIM